MPTPADSLRLAISAETVQGGTPSITWDVFRTTGEGLTYEVSTTISDEIDPDGRGIKDNVQTGATVTGDISFELSDFYAFEALLTSLFASDWGNDPQNTGATYPTTVGSASAIYDASEMKTFAIEKRFTSTALDDGSSTNLFQLFKGCTVDTFGLSITPNEIITGSYGFIGMEMTTPAAATGSTYRDAGTADVMSAPLVTGIELRNHTTNGAKGTPVSWLSKSCFTGADISASNNGRGLVCIGTLGNKATTLGRFEVTISGSLYYTGDEPLDALIDQTEYQFEVTCNDDDGNSYLIFFPRVKFASATALASGTNTDVMVEFTLQALTDGFQKYTMLVERTPNVEPTVAFDDT